MNKSPGFGVLSKIDTKMEKTFQKLKKQRRIEEWLERAKRTHKMAGGEIEQTRTRRDYVTPGVHELTPSITRPFVTANNLKLKLALMLMKQQSLFVDTPVEGPNLYPSVFLKVCDTLKLNGTSDDSMNLHFFLFTLRDKVRV